MMPPTNTIEITLEEFQRLQGAKMLGEQEGDKHIFSVLGWERWWQAVQACDLDGEAELSVNGRQCGMVLRIKI